MTPGVHYKINAFSPKVLPLFIVGAIEIGFAIAAVFILVVSIADIFSADIDDAKPGIISEAVVIIIFPGAGYILCSGCK